MELTTVPSFTFHQGLSCDENHENPIRVEFYRGNVISLRQWLGGPGEPEEDVIINLDHLDALVKAIKKFKKEAQARLNNK